MIWPKGEGEMASHIRSFDWASGPIGPIERWPEALRTSVDLTLASPVAAILLWGPEQIQIYNDLWVAVHPGKHPAALGQRTRECFAELDDVMEPLYRRLWEGEGVVLEDSLLPIVRDGVIENAWWDVIYTPVRGGSGAVEGILCTLAETTAKVTAAIALHILQERQGFLLRLSDMIRAMSDADAIAKTVTQLVAEHFKVDRCFISRISREEGKAWVEHETRTPGLPSAEGEVNLADFPEVMRIAETSTMIFRDVQGDPGLSERDKAAVGGLGLGAFIAAVLRAGERNYFWDLVIATNEPRDWSITDAPLLEEIAERTWVAIERTRTEKALMETEKLAAVGRLASSIAHEINNPLEAVTNLLYLMESADLPADAAQYLRLAQAELSRVSQITVETLRFSRRNTNAIAVRLSDVIESVISLHDGKLKASRVQVERRFRDHSKLVCFPNELRQVIANLIGNAIESMAGCDPSRLCLRVRDANDALKGRAGIRLTVADTGAGMSETTLRRIWEPFFTTKGDTGTGLGLWVSQEIIRKHQGSVQVRSSREQRNRGSVFSLFLPHV